MGTLLRGRSRGFLSALALLSRLAKSHELANWKSAFKAGPSPSLADASKPSCFALPVPGSLYRAFVHTPQWGHPWKQLTEAQWELSWMTLEAGPLGWASGTGARWLGRSRQPEWAREVLVAVELLRTGKPCPIVNFYKLSVEH